MLSLADLYHRGEAVEPTPGCVSIAVVGAHLTGQPLNWQLSSRGARLIENVQDRAWISIVRAGRKPFPPKPGLVRDEAFKGPGIEVEVWAMPEEQFGGFVAGIPAPLGIGSATLEKRQRREMFYLRRLRHRRAEEITSHGGWRKLLGGARLARIK